MLNSFADFLMTVLTVFYEHVFIAFFQVVPLAGGNVVLETNVFLTLGVVMENIRIVLMDLMSKIVERKKEKV